MTSDLIILDKKTIKNKMYYIREKYVMLDSDLAKIYGYTTKDFNRQVKNNIERFPVDFRFQLSDEETKNLSRCKNFTLNISRGYNIKYNPYVFTEQGIYMLMTVLKGEKAIEQSKSLIRIFKDMKDYLISNNLLNQNNINDMLLRHDSEIKQLQETFNRLEEKELKNKIFFNGEIFDSYLEIIKILNKSKIYHLGSSINHLGKKTFAINLIEEKIVKKALLKEISDIINMKVEV